MPLPGERLDRATGTQISILRDGLENEMTDDERIVREEWDAKEIRTGSGCTGRQGRKLVRPDEIYFFVSIDFHDKESLFFSAPTEIFAWRAAAEFTVRRQKKIDDVKEEIKIVRNELSLGRDRWNSPEFIRILAREQAALAELQRGWKGTK